MILPLEALAEPLLLLVGGREAAVRVEVGGDAEPQLRPHHQLVLLVVEQHPPLLLLQPHPLEQPQLPKKADIFKGDEIILTINILLFLKVRDFRILYGKISKFDRSRDFSWRSKKSIIR
jgi:hypothetical protein